MNDGKVQEKGHLSDDLNLDSFMVVPQPTLWEPHGLGIKVLSHKNNCDTMLNAPGKEALNRTSCTSAKVTN